MVLTAKAYKIIHKIDGPQGDIVAVCRDIWLKIPENNPELQKLRKEVGGTSKPKKARGRHETYQWDKAKVIKLIKQYKSQPEIGEAFGATDCAFRGYAVRNPDVLSVWQKCRTQRRSHVVVKGSETKAIKNGLAGLADFFKLDRSTISQKIHKNEKVKGYRIYTYKDWISRGGEDCI